MKKIASILLVLCLVLGVASAALAAGAPKFLEQPHSTTPTTDQKGTIIFKFRGSNYNVDQSSWRFVEPETGNEWTGPQLREEMKNRGVKGFELKASDGKKTLTLKNVPDFMHGWEVYVVLVNNGYEIPSEERAHVWIYGMEQVTPATATGTDVEAPAEPEAPASDTDIEVPAEPEPATDTDVETPAEPETPATDTDTEVPVPPAEGETPAEGTETPAESTETPAEGTETPAEGTEAAPAPAAPVEEEEPDVPKEITITAENVTLYPVDARGNLLEDQPAEALVFEGSGDFAVRCDEPVKYWQVNGMRILPIGDTTGFVLKNVNKDLTISAKLVNSPNAANEIDPDSPCEVICTGCTFTYHAGGLVNAETGTVPAGATIIVFASADAAANGFIINEGDPEHQGQTSFRLKVLEDTTIVVP